MADVGVQPRAYDFTEDFVTSWIPTWQLQFARLLGLPKLKILEIGSFEGRSTVWFLENLLTGVEGSITCVDPFHREGIEERFDLNISLTGASDKVIKIKERSDAYLAAAPADRFDLIYIDGGHDAQTVLFDAMLSWPLLEPGGFFMFDDYGWEPDLPAHDRPKIAIDVFLEAFLGEYDIRHLGYQIILRKRAGRRGDWSRIDQRPELRPVF